jgi:hypothetical protein
MSTVPIVFPSIVWHPLYELGRSRRCAEGWKADAQEIPLQRILAVAPAGSRHSPCPLVHSNALSQRADASGCTGTTTPSRPRCQEDDGIEYPPQDTRRDTTSSSRQSSPWQQRTAQLRPQTQCGTALNNRGEQHDLVVSEPRTGHVVADTDRGSGGAPGSACPSPRERAAEFGAPGRLHLRPWRGRPHKAQRT